MGQIGPIVSLVEPGLVLVAAVKGRVSRVLEQIFERNLLDEPSNAHALHSSVSCDGLLQRRLAALAEDDVRDISCPAGGK